MDFSTSEFIKQNRRIIGPVILFVLSFFIILRVILPLFSSISVENQKINDSKKQIENLNSTYSSIQSINQDNIENNINLVQSALPQTKDIILIYSTIVDVAAKNSMNVDSFAVKVGQIYSKNNKPESSKTTTIPSDYPTLQVSVKLSSDDPQKLFNFSKQVMQALPLSKVDSVATADNSGSYDLSFYYKPLNAAALSQKEFVSPLDDTERQTLKTIQQFQQH